MATPLSISIKLVWERVAYFFPIQLLVVHLKKNIVLLAVWLMLFAYVSKLMALKFGIPYLFLYPEYLEQVNFLSHLILGFACGGFVMAFNLTSYILNGYRFPFIATLSRPFLKYCINNSIIPGTFIIVYIINLINHQYLIELEDSIQITSNVLGFVLGNILFIALSFAYFFSTNKNILQLLLLERKHINKKAPARGLLHKKDKWREYFDHSSTWRVETYFSSPFKISLTRDSKHYGASLLQKVFEQNHVNASFFEAIILASILIFGLFREMPVFMIPAGSSIFLLLTMLLMLFSALYSWLKGWSTALVLGIILLANFLSNYEQFNYTNYAYGMDYTTKTPYTDSTLKNHLNDSNAIEQSFHQNIESLKNWRIENSKNSLKRNKKPKLIIINSSGGGSRSALWTYHVLSYVDSLLNGELIHHTQLMTGASGGMLGAAYLRELYLQKKLRNDIKIRSPHHLKNISADLLNQIGVTIAVNDLFIRFQNFEDNGQIYTKDRGYAFEQHFNANTKGILHKRLSYYKEPVEKGLIPMMILAPTILNDARRLLISSQPISYLINSKPDQNVSNDPIIENIEFTRFFNEQDPYSLQFITALRMNATFPYILPNTSMPSEPVIQLTDAGVRDNFGLDLSLKYIHTFRNWISTNTSGVIILEIRDKFKDQKVKFQKLPTRLEALAKPLGGIYSNFTTIHHYHQDQLLQYTSTWFDGKIDIIPFELGNDEGHEISLSWHLTKKEKQHVLESIYLKKNQESIARLTKLLD